MSKSYEPIDYVVESVSERKAFKGGHMYSVNVSSFQLEEEVVKFGFDSYEREYEVGGSLSLLLGKCCFDIKFIECYTCGGGNTIDFLHQ